MSAVIPILSLALALVSDQGHRPARPTGLAGPGIQGLLGPDEIVVYRTSLSREESEQIIDALERGRPDEAFRASKRIGVNIVGHSNITQIMQRAERRGQVPLFTTPYPSTAWLYVESGWTHDKSTTLEPLTWAIVVPRDAVIWENSRAYQTQGVFYSLTYPDAELVIDASKVRRILLVPPDLLEAIGMKTRQLAEDNIARTSFRNAFRDKDPALAEAAREAIIDLRMPPAQLGRPFLEVPVELPGIGGVMAGQRVMLIDGQVVTIKGMRLARRANTGVFVHRPLSDIQPSDLEDGWPKLEVKGLRDWILQDDVRTFHSMDLLGPLNLRWDWLHRPIQKGERVKITERTAVWNEHRDEIRARIESENNAWRGFADQARASDDEHGLERYQRGMAHMNRAMTATSSGMPPWR